MDDPCGLSDLTQLVSGENTHFPLSTFSQIVSQAFSGQQNFAQAGEDSRNHYDLIGVTGHCLVTDMLPEFNSDCATATRSASAGAGATSLSDSFEVETACDGGDGPGSGRWPRQETLALLEIRSRLDHKFREANQKGPLWDEVSRFMSEEHGYQRSGKKCREKFENLYKYYKKTKEGKAGRQDGKHYRFFRQLDALYGETKNAVAFPQTHCLETRTFQLHDNGVLRAQKANQEAFRISLSNCSDFNSTSSDENGIFTVGVADSDVYGEKRRKRQGRSWGEEIKEFIDLQVRKMMEKQEVWLDKLMKALELKERERMVREEEWRRQEVLRIEREQKIWAKERECIEARDAALMAALAKLTGRELANSFLMAENGDEGDCRLESRKPKEICKKRKEKSSLFGNVNGYSPSIRGNNDHGLGEGLGESSRRLANKESSPCSYINGVQGSCLKILMNEGEPLWENYGLKLNNGDINQ